MKPEFIFVSDIHLSSSGNRALIPLFRSFLSRTCRGARGLYLLGDLFDFWVGKGMLGEAALEPVFTGIRDLVQAGTQVGFVRGNRDFMLGETEARYLGISLLGESFDLKVGEDRLFLTHGDLFCTRDRAYQRLKKVLQNPIFMRLARLLPQSLALRLARRLRKDSRRAVQKKTLEETALDMNMIQAYIEKGYSAVLCGHIHQRNDVSLAHGGRLITLPAWHTNGGGYAVYENRQLSLRSFSA